MLATGAVVADIDGRSVSEEVTSASCGRVGRDPVAFEFLAWAGLYAFEYNPSARSEVELLIAGGSNFVQLGSDDVSVKVVDAAGQLEVTWDSPESTGRLELDCGDVIIDAEAFADYLRGS